MTTELRFAMLLTIVSQERIPSYDLTVWVCICCLMCTFEEAITTVTPALQGRCSQLVTAFVSSVRLSCTLTTLEQWSYDLWISLRVASSASYICRAIAMWPRVS